MGRAAHAATAPQQQPRNACRSSRVTPARRAGRAQVPLLQTTLPFLCQTNAQNNFCIAEVSQALAQSSAPPRRPPA